MSLVFNGRHVHGQTPVVFNRSDEEAVMLSSPISGRIFLLSRGEVSNSILCGRTTSNFEEKSSFVQNSISVGLARRPVEYAQSHSLDFD